MENWQPCVAVYGCFASLGRGFLFVWLMADRGTVFFASEMTHFSFKDDWDISFIIEMSHSWFGDSVCWTVIKNNHSKMTSLSRDDEKKWDNHWNLLFVFWNGCFSPDLPTLLNPTLKYQRRCAQRKCPCASGRAPDRRLGLQMMGCWPVFPVYGEGCGFYWRLVLEARVRRGLRRQESSLTRGGVQLAFANYTCSPCCLCEPSAAAAPSPSGMAGRGKMLSVLLHGYMKY